MTIGKTLHAFCLLLMLSGIGAAEGTRLWQQTKYDEFEKGTARSVAINSDGSLSLAPAFTALYTSPSAYLWDLVCDAEGNVYAAAGSPARVYRVTPEGKAIAIFGPQELSVQALAIDPAGTIYAATSPDGKVYKLTRNVSAPPEKSKSAKAAAKPIATEADLNYSATVYFDPKTKYIWSLALDKQGNLYVGTGDRGEIYRVDPNGTGTLFFKSDEAQIRALTFDVRGNLIAGTDGSGLIYRITPQGDAFALYNAAKKEITALAVDVAGNIYAAGAGDKRSNAAAGGTSGGASGTNPIAIQQAGAPGAQGAPGVTPVPFPNVINVGGSEIYRISTDGAPKTIWSSKDDIVYALGFDSAGQLVAGTGNKGKLYSIGESSFSDLSKASANQVTALAHAPQGGLYAATSNLGKVFLIGPKSAPDGVYESDVFDARIFSRWGRAEVRGSGNFELYARSGNVENPDRNWSPWTRIDVGKSQIVDAPPARFLQWKAALRSGNPAPVIEQVGVNYLTRNVAPEVDEVSVLVGARVPSSTHTSNTNADSSGFETPIPTVADRRYIAVRWRAHDVNDDSLSYTVHYRGDGETQWKTLREDSFERYANLETDLFPDGGYTIRIVATDAPSHSPGEALTGERTSDHFEVDNTPPRVDMGDARIEGNKVHVTFRATDSFSPIARAEFSIDAGDWQTVEPVGQISDSRTENYDLLAPLPAVEAKEGRLTEHVVVVRVFDRFDNVGVGKAVVKTVNATPAKTQPK
jgi:WD40 repeat protein